MARPIASLLLIGGLTLACASAKIHKVPRPEEYALAKLCSGDENQPCKNEIQRQADAIKGVRYYLPRPYVVVKQEFPVGGGTFFASGTLDDDNRIVTIDSAAEEVRALFPDLKIPVAGTKRSGFRYRAGSGPDVP